MGFSLVTTGSRPLGVVCKLANTMDFETTSWLLEGV